MILRRRPASPPPWSLSSSSSISSIRRRSSVMVESPAISASANSCISAPSWCVTPARCSASASLFTRNAYSFRPVSAASCVSSSRRCRRSSLTSLMGRASSGLGFTNERDGRRPLEPAAPLEEAEQNKQGDQLGPNTDADERLPMPDPPGEPTEVLAEEAGQPAQRQKDGRDHRQLLHHCIQPVRDRREVDVHRTRQQVAIAVDQF